MKDKFKNRREIEESVLAIDALLSKWGLNYNDWMLGKNASLYFCKIFNKPSQIYKDITVHINSSKLPWKITRNSRSIVPPSNSRYLKEYVDLQNKLKIGIDFWPAPDESGNLELIQKNQFIIKLDNKKINTETLEKYIKRRLRLSEKFIKMNPEKIRDFYYADKERYRERVRDYQKMINKAKKMNLTKTFKLCEETLDLYKKLIHRAYPEIFQKNISQKSELKGIVAMKINKTIKGKILTFEDFEKSNTNNAIIAFSHFGPSETNYIYKAKAILTQGGGMTSHAAVVCREAKVPCIVGIRGLMDQIKSGYFVELNFDSGKIKIIP